MPARILVMPKFISVSSVTQPAASCHFDFSDFKPSLEDAQVRLIVYDLNLYITTELGIHEEIAFWIVDLKKPSILPDTIFFDKDPFTGQDLDTFVPGTLRDPVFVPGQENRRALAPGVIAVLDGVLHRSKARKDKPWFMSVTDKVENPAKGPSAILSLPDDRGETVPQVTLAYVEDDVFRMTMMQGNGRVLVFRMFLKEDQGGRKAGTIVGTSMHAPPARDQGLWAAFATLANIEYGINVSGFADRQAGAKIGGDGGSANLVPPAPVPAFSLAT